MASRPLARPPRRPPCSGPVPTHLPSPRDTTGLSQRAQAFFLLRLSPRRSYWGSHAASIYLDVEDAHSCGPQRPSSDAAFSRHVLTVFSETLPAFLGALHAGPTLLFTDVGIALRPPPAEPATSLPALHALSLKRTTMTMTQADSVLPELLGLHVKTRTRRTGAATAWQGRQADAGVVTCVLHAFSLGLVTLSVRWQARRARSLGRRHGRLLLPRFSEDVSVWFAPPST